MMHKNNFLNILTKKQFARFVFVGGIATLIDWSTFYILAITLSIYYQFSLLVGLMLGSITHFILNKMFTFKCKSKRIISQFLLFSAIAILSILANSLLMFIFIEKILIGKMISRIITTILIVSFNYIMHKNLTFNKKIFK